MIGDIPAEPDENAGAPYLRLFGGRLGSWIQGPPATVAPLIARSSSAPLQSREQGRADDADGLDPRYYLRLISALVLPVGCVA